MFEDYTSTQLIADQIKQLIRQAKPKGRRAAMDVLQRFEGCGWHPGAFEEVSAERLRFDDRGRLTYSGADALADITDILTRYLDVMGCAPVEFPDPMGIEDAARYLGLTVDGVKWHVHRTGQLVPLKVGHTLLFSKALLDEFNEERRPAGRPKQVEHVEE